jgi:hypothetical protein
MAMDMKAPRVEGRVRELTVQSAAEGPALDAQVHWGIPESGPLPGLAEVGPRDKANARPTKWTKCPLDWDRRRPGVERPDRPVCGGTQASATDTSIPAEGYAS